LFDYKPEKILLGGAETGEYHVEVARAFLERLTLVAITGSELEKEESDAEWETEEVRDSLFVYVGF